MLIIIIIICPLPMMLMKYFLLIFRDTVNKSSWAALHIGLVHNFHRAVPSSFLFLDDSETHDP